jgi:hypothetical protein
MGPADRSPPGTIPMRHPARLPLPLSRREMLSRAGLGMGSLSLATLLADAGLAHPSVAEDEAISTPRRRAKHVIHIFTAGGASQVDTFDPKPKLNEYHGRLVEEVTKDYLAKAPEAAKGMGRLSGKLMGSPFTFAKHGQSGIEVSELMPHVAGVIDDICVVRSLTAKNSVHELAQLIMNTGDAVLARPSVGAWVVYGLGSENDNLPAFVHLSSEGRAAGGDRTFGSAFLPNWTAGTGIATRGIEAGRLDPARLIENLRSGSASLGEQRRQIELIERLHRQYAADHGADAFLDGRIAQFETAFRMQVEARDAFDMSRESVSAHRLYGETFMGRQCLLARRLVERGVRFVQIFHNGWDTHDDNDNRHRTLCLEGDQPLAALIKDLKARDMLDDTLIVWAGEFGRTPTTDNNNVQAKRLPGRDHNAGAFTILLAGGGIRGGQVYGSSDDFGAIAVENPLDVHDLHATILYALGLDHTKLTFRHSGRDFRLTDVHGRVIESWFV